MTVSRSRVVFKERSDLVSRLVIFGLSLLALAALLAILVVVVQQAVPAYRQYGFFKILFGVEYSPRGGYGIWASLAVTLFTSVFAIVIGAPIALRVAFFIVFRAKWARKPLTLLVGVMAGVPSVVYGIFALKSLGSFSALFLGGPAAGSIFNATIMLTLMVVPTMVALMTNQVRLASKEGVEGAVALGCTKTYASYKVVRKQIKSGYWVAVVTAFTRAVGETMAMSLVLNTGTLANPFTGGLGAFLNSSQRSLGSQIAINIFSDASSVDAASPHFAAGAFMFVFTMVLIGVIARFSSTRLFKSASPAARVAMAAGRIKGRPAWQRGFLYIWFWLTLPLLTLGWLFSAGGSLLGWGLAWIAALLGRPLTKAFYPRRRPGASRQDYYTRAATSHGPRVLDGVRLAFEIFSVLLLVGFSLWLVLDVFATGFGAWSPNDWSFVASVPSHNPFEPAAAAVPSQLANTLAFTVVLVAISIAITLPFALATAVYLSEYARFTPVGKAVRFLVDSLGGTPSIMFGIFGLAFFTHGGALAVSPGFSVLAGALTCVLVVLPTFTRSIEQVLVAVPAQLRDGAYALGASHFETIVKVVLPQAVPGIVTGIVLSAGRIIAETAPLYLTMGMQGALTLDVANQGWTMTTAIYNNQLYGIGSLAQRTLESYKIASLAILLVGAITAIAYSVQPSFRWANAIRLSRMLKKTNRAAWAKRVAERRRDRKARWNRTLSALTLGRRDSMPPRA